jgi:hypothetical protein
MDTNTLINHSRARFDHAVARRVLREKYQAKMTFAYQGGLFKAGPKLLSLLQTCIASDSMVIEDLYQNPVRIKPQELHQMAFERWQEQMNAWQVEFDQLSQKR